MLEKTLESPLDCKDIQPVHSKGDQSWVFIGGTDVEAETPTLATWCEELTHLKRSWCWERLKTGGEGDDREWDGWMTSPTRWTWIWVVSGSWWWTGKPGVLQSMGLQRVGHDWATELILTHYFFKICAALDTIDCLTDSLSILASLVSFYHFGFLSPLSPLLWHTNLWGCGPLEGFCCYCCLRSCAIMKRVPTPLVMSSILKL